MIVIKGLDKLEKHSGPSAVAIGVFDGVHIGHQLIIGKTVEAAKAKGWKSVVVTFDPHPLDVLKPRKVPTVLTSLPLKLKLIEDMGVEETVVVEFTKDFSGISAERFIKETLVEKLNVKLLIVGERFCLGKGKEGDVAFLSKMGDKYGFEVNVLSRIKDPEGHTVSSTHIRNLINMGDLKDAARILGHYPMVTGKVEPGTGRGELTGYKTANIMTQDKASIPKSGVYAGKVNCFGKDMAAVIHIGMSPTFKIRRRRIEAHIIGFSEQLYGEMITITLIKRLREIFRFEDHQKLAEQIKADVESAKQVLK